jgi:hypothetical protein
MCKKLIVLCIVVGLMSMPASAAYIGFPDGCANPLKVDINGGGAGATKCSWQGWTFARDWTGPITQQFANPKATKPSQLPIAQLEAFRTQQANSAAGLSRDRSGGFAGVAGTGEYNGTSKNFGTSYVKLTLAQLQPSTTYKVSLWSYEAFGIWSSNSNNPNSKYGVWSTQNPLDWLTANGYPIGYSPIQPVPDPITGASGMPCGLQDVALNGNGDRTAMMAPLNDNNDYLGGTAYRATICEAETDSDGVLVIYGWIDPTDYAGSMHMPLNGFMVVPEPVTIALLGLGGLALIRRKRA